MSGGAAVGEAVSTHMEIMSSQSLLRLNDGAQGFSAERPVDVRNVVAVEATAVAVPLSVLSSSFVHVVAAAYAASLGSFESLCKLWVVGFFVFVLRSSDGVPSSGAPTSAWSASRLSTLGLRIWRLRLHLRNV